MMFEIFEKYCIENEWKLRSLHATIENIVLLHVSKKGYDLITQMNLEMDLRKHLNTLKEIDNKVTNGGKQLEFVF